ncbi:MAG: DNA polymerase III subunit delta [Bacteroidaceae bacterium]|nr:DNA polymerase III subunit delta [Bacteroidaceae bacterium]
MAKEVQTTFDQVMAQAREGRFATTYLLQGDEDYYIDKAAQALADHALRPEERDFNMDMVYGSDTRANDVINMARQYPMMAERRVVVVREFQSMTGKEVLSSYIKNPMQSTILILCHKHGTLDGRKAPATDIKKHGVVMVSNRLYDNQLPAFVTGYATQQQMSIDPQAAQMLCEHVGSDLTRLASEIDKLKLAVGQGRQITAQAVEEQTGISKEYNIFELQNALGRKDVVKANKIVNYFDTNPKNFALQPALSSLFGFFTDVMTAYYSPDQSDNGIAQWVGKNPFIARQALIPARHNYGAKKVMDIIAKIRETDALSKGVGGEKTPVGDLLRELVFYILH